eukprot:13036683-Ditylum_brightwellii.AAC.1
MDGTNELNRLAHQFPEETNLYQRDKNKSIRGQIRKAAKSLRQGRLNSYAKQQDYLKIKTLSIVHEDYPEKKNKEMRKVLKRMQTVERNLKMYKTFRTYFKAVQNSSLTHIDVPDSSEMWLYLLALFRVLFCHRGKWGWRFGIMCLLWMHAIFNTYNLFSTNVPHK